MPSFEERVELKRQVQESAFRLSEEARFREIQLAEEKRREQLAIYNSFLKDAQSAAEDANEVLKQDPRYEKIKQFIESPEVEDMLRYISKHCWYKPSEYDHYEYVKHTEGFWRPITRARWVKHTLPAKINKTLPKLISTLPQVTSQMMLERPIIVNITRSIMSRSSTSYGYETVQQVPTYDKDLSLFTEEFPGMNNVFFPSAYLRKYGEPFVFTEDIKRTAVETALQIGGNILISGGERIIPKHTRRSSEISDNSDAGYPSYQVYNTEFEQRVPIQFAVNACCAIRTGVLKYQYCLYPSEKGTVSVDDPTKLLDMLAVAKNSGEIRENHQIPGMVFD